MEKLQNPEQRNVPESISGSTLLSKVPSINKPGIVSLTREDLANLVETPLLEACEELYDKNIKTLMSSANSKNVNGDADIWIDFETLSEENKVIALSLGTLQEMNGSVPTQCVQLRFPVSTITTVGDIRKMAHEAVSQFKKQEMKWAERYTLDELAELYGTPRENLTPESFPDMYYDAQTGYLYGSEEHYRKTNNLA